MRLPRPYVPLSIRVQVAERQLLEIAPWFEKYGLRNICKRPISRRLNYLLTCLFGPETPHLDHDPALGLRKRRGNKYFPDANDPNYLVYRTTEDHKQKTFRRNGANFSDVVLMKRERRRKRKAKKVRRAWASRPFPKQSRRIGK